MHGLMRKLIANMATGVSKGFTRVLEINGVGYRAEVKGSQYQLSRSAIRIRSSTSCRRASRPRSSAR